MSVAACQRIYPSNRAMTPQPLRRRPRQSRGAEEVALAVVDFVVEQVDEAAFVFDPFDDQIDAVAAQGAQQAMVQLRAGEQAVDLDLDEAGYAEGGLFARQRLARSLFDVSALRTVALNSQLMLTSPTRTLLAGLLQKYGTANESLMSIDRYSFHCRYHFWVV
jgi:hypothetical protein